MNITRFSIKRPIGICMIYILVCVLGLISFFRIGVELLPDVDSKFISVIVNYPGASTESVEQQVTKPIEDELSSISHFKQVRSATRPGRAEILSSWTVRPMPIWWLSRQPKKSAVSVRICRRILMSLQCSSVPPKNIRLSRLQQRLRITWTIFLPWQTAALRSACSRQPA